jgi:phage-related protein
MAATNIHFDVLNLQDGANIFTTSTDVFSAPPVLLQTEKLAETDGTVIVKKTFDGKVIKCQGYMQTDTVANLDLLLDNFKRGLNKQNQNFDIDYAGSTRRYMATPQNVVISRTNGLNTAGWSADFYCANPVGMDTSSSTLLGATTITSSTGTSSIVVDGSYKADPIIFVTLTSLTGSGNHTITISNDATLRGVSVTRTWTAGDVLEIDCLNKTVYVNNGVVPFAGQFPSFDPGNGGIDYLDDFTARSATISATYTRRFL